MFKKLSILGLVLLSIVSLCLVTFNGKNNVKAEVIHNENLKEIKLVGLKGKSKVLTVSKEKLKSFNVKEPLVTNLTRKVLLDYDSALKKSGINKEKTTVYITKSKDSRYVSVHYKIQNAKKQFTTLSYILDVKKSKMVTDYEILKNATKFKSNVASKWAKELKVTKSDLLTVPNRMTQPIQFKFNKDGELVCTLDKLNVRPKMSTSGIAQVSNPQDKLNKKEVKVNVPQKELKK